jgi:phage repressor protein C with HTH and peptisase S24 domain
MVREGSAVPVNAGDFPVMVVPVVSQFAYAGYLRGYADDEYMDRLPKMPWPVEGEHKGAYVTFQVRGDSMDDGTKDAYGDGDLLLCREIARPLWEKSKLHIKKWDFVIVHKTEGILIKRIIQHDVEKGLITIHSLNDFYPDQQLKLQHVSQIFNVVQSLRKR